jgi:diguanylate cyclase (GGDEF)-like protein
VRGPFQTIFTRLLVGALSLVLLAIGPTAWVTLHSYHEALERHYGQEVDVVAAGLASAAFNSAAARDLPTLQEIVTEVAAKTPVDVAAVTDRNGRIWAHSDQQRLGEQFEPFPEDDYLTSATEIRAGGRLLGTARTAIARSRLEAESQRPVGLLALGFAGVLVLASALAVLFSLSTARPIRRLTEAAREIAGGRLDQPLGEMGGPREVREMASTFEEMRLSLHTTLGQLNDSYRQLDRKVKDLTILYGISEAMNAGDYSEGLLDTILGEAVKGLNARYGAIWVAGETEEEEARLVATAGVDRRGATEPVFDHLQMVAMKAVAEGEPVTDAFVPEEPRPVQQFVSGFPLHLQSEAGGAMVVARPQEPFASEDTDLLEALASQAARCVERAQLYTAAITDGLTGLYVSRYFRHRLKEELRTAERYRRNLSVVMVDIDYFKKVNDTHGHQAGDDVLRVVARCLLDTVREGIDIAARYGGEEFALILPETNLEGAGALAERLRRLIEKQRVDVGGVIIQVTTSCGVATSPDHGSLPEVLVERADQALYRAKENGRNRVEVATSRGTT